MLCSMLFVWNSLNEGWSKFSDQIVNRSLTSNLLWLVYCAKFSCSCSSVLYILFTNNFRIFLPVFNRKGAVIINNILGVLGAVLFVSSRYAGSVEMLLLARLVVGLSSGE